MEHAVTLAESKLGLGLLDAFPLLIKHPPVCNQLLSDHYNCKIIRVLLRTAILNEHQGCLVPKAVCSLSSKGPNYDIYYVQAASSK